MLAMAGAASAHQAATASREDTSPQRAGRRQRISADPQRDQQGATAAAAAAPAAQDNLSRLQQLADASPQVAQLRRLQALADAYYAPAAQLAGGPEEELVQGKFASAQLQPQLQQAPRANNTGLPDQLKSGVESLSGLSMDHVRVHYNSSQPAQLNALAYAQCSDIHLAPGQEQHLPHEAWHVVQQAQGRVTPTMQAKGVPVNDDADLEQEADRMGMLAANWQGVGLVSKGEASTLYGGDVAQRVRGGIEYTEDAPTQLDLHQPPPAPGLGAAAVDRLQMYTIGGAPMSIFAVPTIGDLGARVNYDQILFQSNQVKLTNDVRSAEWVIERHGADVTVAAMCTNLRNDVAAMFNLRGELAADVPVFEVFVDMFLGRPVIALVPGDVASLHLAPGIFVYRPGPNKGKAQITVQYTAEEAIRRINLLNASKFRTGTKVAEGEDTARVAGTESIALRAADLAGTTAFSSAQAMLTALENTSQAIPQTVPAGAMLPAPLRLTARQVGLIKLMVLNDAMATTMVRYNARLGQAQDKNVQRFFPKSRRDEYTRAVAAANLSAGEMAALRIEINRTAAADALLAFNGADPGALLVDQTFNALGGGHADMLGMLDARQKLAGVIPGAPAAADLNNIKTHVLGANGVTVATWIARASEAYTDTTAFTARNAGNTDHYQAGGAGAGNVIRSTEGFTPVAGAGPGAVYEFREREITIDESGWFNVGSRADIEAAIAALFVAA